MMLEDRLSDHLRSAAEELTVAEADLAGVVARGRRRRVTRYIATGMVTGALVVAAVMATPDSTTVSDIAGPDGTSIADRSSPGPIITTLTSGGCTVEAPGPIEAGGWTTFEVRNNTSSLASFQLLRMHGTYDEFTRAFADIQQRNTAGEDLDVEAELADLIDHGQRIQVEAGESGEIVTELTPGDYAMWCISLDEHEDIVTAWTAGPYTVIDG
jgi:hypothetical protein